MIGFFDRLDIYMKFKGLNDNKITVEAGISNGLIGKGRKRGSLSQDNISKLLCTYSDLSADWLLTGRGNMLHDEQTEQLQEPTIIYKSDPKDIEIIAAKDFIIQRDAELIASLQCRIRDLDNRLTLHAPDLDIARSADTTTTGTKSTHK